MGWGKQEPSHAERLETARRHPLPYYALLLLAQRGPFDHVIRLSSREYSNVGIHPMKVLVEYMMRRALVVSAEE